MNESNKNKNYTLDKILEDSKDNELCSLFVAMILGLFLTEEQRKKIDEKIKEYNNK